MDKIKILLLIYITCSYHEACDANHSWQPLKSCFTMMAIGGAVRHPPSWILLWLSVLLIEIVCEELLELLAPTLARMSASQAQLLCVPQCTPKSTSTQVTVTAPAPVMAPLVKGLTPEEEGAVLIRVAVHFDVVYLPRSLW